MMAQTPEARKQSYLEQLLNFVDFKECVYLTMYKISEIKLVVYSDTEIGYSLSECETLIKGQDCLEMQCREIYERYSKLKKTCNDAIADRNFLAKQFSDYWNTLESSCHTLAAILVGRRCLLVAAAKFHSHLLEFRKEIRSVKNFREQGLKMSLDYIIEENRASSQKIKNLASCVLWQGMQLTDILIRCRYLKATGQERYRQHIAGWMSFVRTEIDSRLIELNETALRLQVLKHIERGRTGIRQVIEALTDMNKSMLSQSHEIGESAEEADILFLQHVKCKYDAQESFRIGKELLELSRLLQDKVDLLPNLQIELEKSFNEVWETFLKIFLGIIKRLDICQNFYRNLKKNIDGIQEWRKIFDSKLKYFGEVRRDFVVRKFTKSWKGIRSSTRNTLRIGEHLLETMKTPLTEEHRVDLVSCSAVIHIVRTMSEAEKLLRQTQSSCLQEDPATESITTATESITTATYASPDTWRSTSLSGIDDWCSIGSGTTLDDFKSLEDDLPEEYISDDDIEELPPNGQTVRPKEEVQEPNLEETETGIADEKKISEADPSALEKQSGNAYKVDAVKTEYTSVSPKYSTRFDSVKRPSASEAEVGDGKTEMINTETLPTSDSSSTRDYVYEESNVSASPKLSETFKPTTYTSRITKMEATDVKTETKKTYQIKSSIPFSGIKSADGTSHPSTRENLDKYLFNKESEHFRPSVITKTEDIDVKSEIKKVSEIKTINQMEDLQKDILQESQLSTSALNKMHETEISREFQCSIREPLSCATSHTLPSSTENDLLPETGKRNIKQMPAATPLSFHSKTKSDTLVDTKEAFPGCTSMFKTEESSHQPLTTGVERIHKVVLSGQPRLSPKELSSGESFTTSHSKTKSDLLSEIESLKSKYLKSQPLEPNLVQNITYGSGDLGEGMTDISKVVYSKEVTESQTTTSISFQQRSLGANRTEKWQSVTSPKESEGTLENLEYEIKKSKEWMQLKIQEMQPAMTDIGSSWKEASDLYQQHEKVLQQLQTKQSPVEELLRQADELISSQKPRGEVYSAMAENLGLAWQDLNAQLEQRRHILEQAVAFLGAAQQFTDSLDVMKVSVSETFLPNAIESTVSILNRIKEERKAALSHSMRLLSEGQLLLERLCEVATHSMGDSRPYHMEPAARATSASVERRMEHLQDRWRHLEPLFLQRKKELEQCVLRCQLECQMKEVEDWLNTRGAEYLREDHLGDSLANSEILLHEHHKTETQCKEMQEISLRLVKSLESVSPTEDLRTRAYGLLSECADLSTAMEQRRYLLTSAVDFFTQAQTAQTKLDQIELQLSINVPVSSCAVEEAVDRAIDAGRQILLSTQSQGVKRKVDELEMRKKKISDLCNARHSLKSEKTEAYKKFCEKYEELMKWLSNNGQFFVQRSRDMGTTATAAKSFFDQHQTLQNDVRMKGMEVDALLRMVPTLVRCGGAEAEEVHSKSNNLQQEFEHLRTCLEERIMVSQRYLAFLRFANKVLKEMDDIEGMIGTSNIAEKQISLRQEMMQLKNNGKNFLQDAKKVKDTHLNLAQPCATVEDTLNRLEERNEAINTQWRNYQNESGLQGEQLTRHSNRIIKCVQELEKKMFPVVPQHINKVDSILSFLENKLREVIPQIKNAQRDIELVLKQFEVAKSNQKPSSESTKVVQSLSDIQLTLQKRLTDYQILVAMMTTFFKNYDELEKLVDMQETQYRLDSLPNDVTRAGSLLLEHESSKHTVLELFKFSHTEAQQLMQKIRDVEPPEPASKDCNIVSNFLSGRKLTFERAWDEHRNRLENHHQLCRFFNDMHQINQQIEDLNSQLSLIRQSYGDSLPSARYTSEAFLQFEKTLEVLQVRIKEFVSTAEYLMRDRQTSMVNSDQVRTEIETMQKRWSTFRTEVSHNRRLIDIAVVYYKTVEEAEEWLKEGSRLLISVARKSSSCSQVPDAESLQKEIQDFLQEGQPKQEERMRTIHTLSRQLDGAPPSISVDVITSKNKEMLDSFTVITSELKILTRTIKTSQVKLTEQQRKVDTVRPPIFVRQLRDAEVTEGVKFKFECEVDGQPKPQIQWLKDGIPVEQNPDYQTTEEGGVCRLTIEETFSEDTARFSCKATNEGGMGETQCHLHVKESHPQSDLVAPLFVRIPQDCSLVEGDGLAMTCQVSGNPLPLVSWYKDDVCIDDSTDYSIAYNNGLCTLKIDRACLEHAGRYTCTAANPAGQVACSAILKITTAIPCEIPRFVSPLTNVMARAGQKLRLECSISGHPQPQVSWLHNSKTIKENRDTKFQFDGKSATLVITEAFPKDAGIYTIIAQNSSGEAVSTCNVSVKGRLPLETSDSEIASDIEPAKPQVRQHLEDQAILEGNKVRMDCIIVGQPEPEVIWYHNGEPVKESDDFQLLFEGDRCTLVIEMAYLEDAGTYKCVAINSGGEAFSSCQLTVYPAPKQYIEKSQTSQKDVMLTVERIEPPKFLRLLDNMFLSEGEELVLECQVTGEPGYSIAWFKDGSQLRESSNCMISSDSTGLHRLRIPCAQLGDRGTYSVKAQNRGSEAQSICTVSVASTAPVKFGQMPTQVPPTFLQHVANRELTEGGTACFETMVDGTPKPTVRWNFKGKPVPKDDRHEVGNDGNMKHWLIVRNVQVSQVGRYSAIAENNSGIATTSALLTIPEGTSACEEQRAAESMVMTRKAVMQTSTISSMTELIERDCETLQSPVPPSEQLTKLEQSSSTQSKVLLPETQDLETSTSQLVSPKFMKPVAATVITEGEKLFLEAHFTAYREAPKFIQKFSAAVVKSGFRVSLEAVVAGFPTPEVKWFRNDRPLTNSPDFRITSIGNSHFLVIPEAFPDDSGSFMAVASNAAGEARCLADLVVEEILSPEEEKRITYQEFSSRQETRQMFTTVCKGVTPLLEPYQSPPETKIFETTLPKTPSPPPIPAVCAKVWTQPRPKPITPAITETQEPELITDPDPLQMTVTFGSPVIDEASSVSSVKKSIQRFSYPDSVSHSENMYHQAIGEKQSVLQNGFHPSSSMVCKSSFSSQSTIMSGTKYFSQTVPTVPKQQSSTTPKLVPFGELPTNKTASTYTDLLNKSLLSSETQTKEFGGSLSSTETQTLTPEHYASFIEHPMQLSGSALLSTETQTKPLCESVWSSETQTPLSAVSFTSTETQTKTSGETLLTAETQTGSFVLSSETQTKPSIESLSSAETQTLISEGTFCSTDNQEQPSDKPMFSAETQTKPLGEPLLSTETQTLTSLSSAETQTKSAGDSTDSSCQTLSSTKTVTKTSFSTEEVSVTKKYELVTEQTVVEDNIKDGHQSTVTKPIIKKTDVPHQEGYSKVKKEVVIEEEPVIGAEVEPPHFSKVRGESGYKIFTLI